MNMNVKQIAAVGVMSAALIGVGTSGVVAAGAATTSAPSSSTCLPANADGAWPAVTYGAPARDAGVRVWRDSSGWHVRVTHDALHDRQFSGEIVTTGTLIDVHAVRLEKNDYVKVSPDKHRLYFHFNNYGGVDGIDFATHCAPFLAFGFRTDGHLLSTSHISVGATAFHPKHDPFVIRRRA